MQNLGIITLLPFALSIFFLLWKQDVIFPVIGGLFLGAVLASRFNLLFGFFNTSKTFIVQALTEETNILTLCIVLESLILFWILNRSGYLYALKREVSKKRHLKNRIEYTIFFANLTLFFDRNLSTLLVGIFSKPFTDKKQLTPVKHAYLLNTIPPSISTLIPYTTLTTLSVVTIGAAFSSLGIGYSPLMALYKSIPYQFYNIFSLFILLTTVVLRKDIFLMNLYKTRSSNHDGQIAFGLSLASKSQQSFSIALYGILGTFVAFAGTIVSGFLFGGNGYHRLPILNIQNFRTIFVTALFAGIVFSLLYTMVVRSVPYQQWKHMSGRIQNSLLFVIIYLVFSMCIEVMAQKLELATSLLGFLKQRSVYPSLIPLLFFIFSSIISFLNGSSLVTITSVIPLAVKITSFNMSDPLLVNEILFATIGAVLSGSTFGDINSPFSLNYILATASSEASISEHFSTQILYSLIAFFVTLLFGYVLFMLNIKPYLCIASGFLVIALMFLLLNRSPEKKVE